MLVRVLPLLLVLSLPVQLFGWVQSKTSLDAGIHRVDNQDIRFLLNEQAIAGLQNADGRTLITSDSDPLAALRSAAGAWSQISGATIQFADLSTTPLLNDPDDNSHVVVFHDTPEIRSVLGGALALAAVSWSVASGEITDSDILFNPNIQIRNSEGDLEFFPFSTTLAEGTFDIQSIATHELGHTLGSSHSHVLAATMSPRTPPASDQQSALKADDIGFARAVYGDSLSGFGYIGGTLSLDGGGTANGVLVAAQDPDSGVIMGALTGPADGTFRIGPLPPGNYLVSAEAANGPTFFASDILSVPLNQNVQTRFSRGNADRQLVAVGAGQEAGASFMVENGADAIEIAAIGSTPAGSPGVISNFGAAAFMAAPGTSFDLLLAGTGISGTLTAENIILCTSVLSLRPGSIIEDPVFTIGELPIVRVTVDVAPNVAGIHLATILVVVGEDASVFTGAIIVEGSLVVQNPEFSAAGLVHSASFETGDVAPEEIVSLFGLFLADFDANASLPLGTQLGGATVEVTDSLGATRPALMFAASIREGGGSQLNFMIPEGTEPGAATLTVRRASGGGASTPINVIAVAPGIFTANASGSGVPAANVLRFVDGAFTEIFLAADVLVFPRQPKPIDLGPENHQVFLSLFGTGMRNAAPGSAEVTIDGLPMTAFGPAPSAEFEGLDQLNVLLDRALIGRGLVTVVVKIAGITANVVEISVL